MLTYPVLLENLSKSNNLGVGKTRQGLNVITAAHQLSFVLGESSLALERERLVACGRVFGDASLDAGVEVFCPWSATRLDSGIDGH